MSDVPEELGDHRTAPGVYARLAEEAEVRCAPHAPPRWVALGRLGAVPAR